jgi:hypothetical protein
MVLAASTGEGDARQVELITPPEGAKPGDRIIPLGGDVDFAAFEPHLRRSTALGCISESQSQLPRRDTSFCDALCARCNAELTVTVNREEKIEGNQCQ